MPPSPFVPSLPAFWEIQADSQWRSVDFISDLHLSDEMPRTFEVFQQYLLNTRADAVFILGDLFEVWVGDDSRTSGFEARCTDLLCEAASLRPLAFMGGNRDFLVGTDMLNACGITALADPTVLIAFGQRAMLSHGDALCLADTTYQAFRAHVRSEAWQRDFLSRSLAERRALAREIRDESERRKAQDQQGNWADIDAAAAVSWMHEAATLILVHGHTHSPGSEPMAPGRIRHVLSDWDHDVAPGRAGRGEVLRWQASGFTRLTPQAACGGEAISQPTGIRAA